MKTLRPVRPPVAIEREYHKRIRAMLREMDRSLYWWLRAEYRKAEPEIVGDSAMVDLRAKLKKLTRVWQKKFDEESTAIATRFATEVQKHTTRGLQNQMKQVKLADLGFDLKFTYHSRKERAIFRSIVEQNVNLIKSIASEHLTRVQGVVLRGIETGHDLSRMTQDLEEGFGVSERRAAMIARDQTAKASNNLSRQRLMDYGVKKGKWMHTSSGKTYRDSHVQMDGEIYDLEQGCYDDDYGDYVQPGELVNCHCVCVPVIDFENEETEEPEQERGGEVEETSETETEEEEEYEPPNEVGIPSAREVSEEAQAMEEELRMMDVKYNPIRMLDNPIREIRTEAVIDRIAGGDLTEGSCSSLAFCYVGNRAGFNVRDFRGGESRWFFSLQNSIDQMAKFRGVQSYEFHGMNEVAQAEKTFSKMRPGKEYHFSVGSHAAIVRVTREGRFEYLELQSPDDNGWKPLNRTSLLTRFRCGVGTKGRAMLIDAETLSNSPDFQRLLGYINTAESKQQKGVRGNVK